MLRYHESVLICSRNEYLQVTWCRPRATAVCDPGAQSAQSTQSAQIKAAADVTWSIVARDARSGAFGIGIASKAFAVGVLCPHLRREVGAVSSQSLTNPYLGLRALDLMERGQTAPAALGAVLHADEGRRTRQLHGIDAEGRNHAYTGSDCVNWAGHLVRPGVSVAGNMLSAPGANQPDVVAATLEAYLGAPDRPFAERLLLAMTAGELAGGDKRGRQSGAVRIVSTEDYPDLDLRVDDHQNPIAELWRLYEVAHDWAVARRQVLPTRVDAAGIHQVGDYEAAVKRHLAVQPAVDFSAVRLQLKNYVDRQESRMLKHGDDNDGNDDKKDTDQ